MYYQYELTHFKGDMGHGVASDGLRRSRLFLVGCCVENHALRGRQKSRCIFHYLFLHLTFAAPNDSKTLPPHIPPWSHALPNILPTANANFWLVVVFSQPERQPPKAETPPLSLFFDGLRFSTQNKGTNCGAT